jgi:imidazolonepropionase-like amidohydrolase
VTRIALSGALHRAEELHLLVDLGLKPIDALKSRERTGTLEPGKQADIVACPGNPVENIRQWKRSPL